ncbi:uncharacterized protein BcabD6B2_44010 [Babesia caballi]|uniref:Uncharacterized protein n=1 Tax=Babesia caballi TaxID=5871 RepID=A0AAV4LXN8_BABCB|nr:hypothetical protein BcabD6B2_44010 [Babesia caballi]
MTPPVDIGEGLVVEGEAAEEYLGALSLVIITTHIAPLGFIIVRRICFSLKLGDEGRGGVADGGEDGGVGVILKFSVCFKLVDITVNRIRFDFLEVSKTIGVNVISFTRLRRHLSLDVSKKRFKPIVQALKITGAIFLQIILHGVDVVFNIIGIILNIMGRMFSLETLIRNLFQRTKNSIQYTIICHTTLLNLTIKPLLHLIPNPLH